MYRHYRNIRITDYTYELPPERIAKYPLPERDRSKLLVWDGKSVTDRVFSDLPSLIVPDNILVFNNSRVIRARLVFRKETGAAVEIFCLEPHAPADFAKNLNSGRQVEWKCLVGNLKRWKRGVLTSVFVNCGREHTLNAERLRAEGDAFIVRFTWEDDAFSFAEVLESLGHMPIPPYLSREDEESDAASYQTLYATVSGSVAAPTAGLHFTPAVISALDRAGIRREEVTLHVSAGTFRPVKSELIGDHMMHTEHFFVTRAALERLRGRKITAVGTTTVRTLESLYWLGLSSAAGRWPADGIPSVSQWEPYDFSSGYGHSGEMVPPQERPGQTPDPGRRSSEPQHAGTPKGRSAEPDPARAIDNLLKVMEERGDNILEAKTDIIIVPGYRFRMINSMLTNFHQPRSTLLLLVAAFTGSDWKEIYDHALSGGYRFLSYGDSMLLRP